MCVTFALTMIRLLGGTVLLMLSATVVHLQSLLKYSLLKLCAAALVSEQLEEICQPAQICSVADHV